jgi:hypothetical protein
MSENINPNLARNRRSIDYENNPLAASLDRHAPPEPGTHGVAVTYVLETGAVRRILEALTRRENGHAGSRMVGNPGGYRVPQAADSEDRVDTTLAITDGAGNLPVSALHSAC